jgi:hypothetical protein
MKEVAVKVAFITGAFPVDPGLVKPLVDRGEGT